MSRYATTSTVSVDTLSHALKGTGVALRRRVRLQPAGGPGERLEPPPGKGPVLIEGRRLGGATVPCALLDGPASQAARMQGALLKALYRGRKKECPLPTILVDFPGSAGELALHELPRAVAEALAKESLLDGVPFGASVPGQQLFRASLRDASGLFQHFPAALVFGTKAFPAFRFPDASSGFQRALASEITAIHAVSGKRAAVRTDPFRIGRRVRAAHGQAPPSPPKAHPATPQPATPDAGDGEDRGVSCDYAMQTTVLSLAALRRIGFGPEPDEARDTAGRVALAALGLCAATMLNRAEGFDLRAGCVLVPEEPPRWELLHSNGEVERWHLAHDAAPELLDHAMSAALSEGLRCEKRPVLLTPTEALVERLRAAREAG